MDRLSTFLPSSNIELFDLYEKHVRTFWTWDEVELSKDKNDYKDKLNDDEKFFIGCILGFFARSDQLVNMNILDRFLEDIETLPAKYRGPCKLFYSFQVAMEDIHSLSYETMINELVVNEKEIEKVKNSIQTIPGVKQKAEWFINYQKDLESSFPLRLVAQAIVELVYFSSSFSSIFWFGQRNLLPGVVQFNRFISRDEALHGHFACVLFRQLKNDPEYEFYAPEEIIIEMVKDAVDTEIAFSKDSIPCSMIGMNHNMMEQYVKYIGDDLLRDIGLSPIYNVENPFPFMVALGLTDRSNFFENKETVYAKPIVDEFVYNSDDDDI